MKFQQDVLEPKITKPLRVLFLFESTRGWFETPSAEKHSEILPILNEAFEVWKEQGAILAGTLDADLFSAGESTHLGWHACFLYDVKDFDTVTAMVHVFREKELDRYFRIEAVIGRRFILLEH
ncbi:Uncharacterised protein [Bacillus freudenreichii]|nr:Uncharacterised protein [Bacillus freudenreichii]